MSARIAPGPLPGVALLVSLIALLTAGSVAAQTVVASDAFDRADEIPFLVGGDWAQSAGTGSAQLVGGEVTGVADEAVYTWQGTGVFDDTRQFARARFVQATTGQVGLVLLGGPGQGIVVAWQRSLNQVFFFWYTGGDAQPALLAAPSTIQNGDLLEAELQGGTIYAKVNGTVVASVANTTSLSSGRPGFQTYLAGGVLDDWAAGTPASYTVSGTVTEGAVGVADVFVRASGAYSATTTTDANGDYTLADLPSGATGILITPNGVGRTTTPLSRTVAGPVTANVVGEDFTALPSSNPVVVFDDFDRAIELPFVVGGDWQKAAGAGRANLVGSQIVGLGLDAVYVWQGPGNFDDTRQFARATVTQTTGQVGLALLGSSGQAIVVAWDQSITTLYIYWYLGGVIQGNLATVTSSIQPGDRLEAELQGGTVYAKVNGAIVASALNTTPLSSGRPGFEVFRANGRLDDWEAGTPTGHAVSGTITEDAAPLADVIVRASGAFGRVTTTDATGQYAFTDVPTGTASLVITPNLAGHTMTPLARTIAGPIAADVPGQDFTSVASSNAVVVFDDFDRPAEVPIAPGGDWAKVAGPGVASLANGALVGGASESVYAWQGPGVFDDARQYARARVVQATGQLGLALLADGGQALVAIWNTATASVRISWFAGGVAQSILTTSPSTIAVGDFLEADLIDGRVFAKVNGIVVASAVNTTTLGTGRPGFHLASGGGRLDDWEAGTPAAHVLSGTVTQSGVGIADVVVKASGAFGGLVTTGVDGRFAFTGVPSGATSIALAPIVAGFESSPLVRTVVGPVATDVAGLDFALTPSTAPFVATDDFDRPAELPLQTGELWEHVAGIGTAALSSNEILGQAGDAVYVWQGPGDFPGEAQYARARVVSTTGQIGLALHGASGQAIVAAWDQSITTLYLYWYVGGVIQGNLATVSSSIQPGDVIEAEIQGGTIYAKVDGVVVASAANTTGLANGRPGFETFRAGGRIDDWEAGTPVSRSLSGRISDGGLGLAGVLVRATGPYSATTETDGAGDYVLPNVPDGASGILITPNLVGFAMSPSTRAVPGPIAADVSGLDFAATPSSNDVVASDSFDRPNELPFVVGGDWQKVAGSGVVGLVDNEIVGLGLDVIYTWQGPGVFDPAHQYARARVVATDGQIGLSLLGASGQAIVAAWDQDITTLFVYWYVGGVRIGELATVPSSIQPGDIIEAELSGGTISAKVNGVVVTSVANTTTLSSGRPGFEAFQVGGRLDDWEAGTPAGACGDGLDNDGDGLVDLLDPGCIDAADPSEQNPAVACDDGLDNDGDTLIDLADPDCSDPSDPSEAGSVVACSDGLDNDGDGLVDLLDPGCVDAADPSEQNPAVACDDGLDNDGDGLVDLADPGCSSGSDGSEQNAAIACDDGLDNDGDGLVDLADPGCSGGADGSEQNAAIACDDGLDNDGDGLVDLADPGCSSGSDGSEQNAAIACDDGLDNDGDGLVDLADPGCSSGSDGSEQNAAIACDDGLDNDGDLLIDWPADPDCTSASDPDESSAPAPVPALPPIGWVGLALTLAATGARAARRIGPRPAGGRRDGRG